MKKKTQNKKSAILLSGTWKKCNKNKVQQGKHVI